MNKLNTSLIAFTLLLIGCSGDNTENITNPKTGVFVDSAVSGLIYRCTSGLTGTTNTKGQFTCETGDEVEFALGNTYLGKVAVSDYITPYTLFPNNKIAALNFAQLLQTLDKDGDPTNAITIDEAILKKQLSEKIDFTSPTFDEKIQKLLGDKIVLVSESDALQHLEETFAVLDINEDGTKIDAPAITKPVVTKPETTKPVVKPVSTVNYATVPFITRWSTTSADKKITISTKSNTYSYNYTVDWGDGTTDVNISTNKLHQYTTDGNHTIKITGLFPAIIYLDDNNSNKLKSIDQWGDAHWFSFNKAFYKAKNMVILAKDKPDLSQVTDISDIFNGASSFDSNLSTWDVSTITNMKAAFKDATSFNQDISTWNVAKVTNMNDMFNGATAFNSDISKWNVAKVTNMDDMFYKATAFDSNISAWNISNVTHLGGMFCDAAAFNQDISDWNVSNVTDMSYTFDGASEFNSSIKNWSVSKVTTLNSTFANTTKFDVNISGWDVSNVTDMNKTFYHAAAFDQNLSEWNVSKVTLHNDFNTSSLIAEPTWP